MKKNLIFIVLLIALIAIAGFLIVYFAQTTKEITPTEKVSQEKVFSLCKNFEVVEGEISCQKAVEIVKEKFEGEIISIDKEYNFPLYFVKSDGREIAYLSFPSSPEKLPPGFEDLPEPEFYQKDTSFWLIEIEREVKISPELLPKEMKEKIKEETIKKKEAVIVDLHTGKIL